MTQISFRRLFFGGAAAALATMIGMQYAATADDDTLIKSVEYNSTAVTAGHIAEMDVKKGDWPMWGGSSLRNNVPDAKDIPTQWDVGVYDEDSKTWTEQDGIKWTAALGTQTYGNPVIANGRVYVGTNNGAGYIKRYPAPSADGGIDLGCLICFDEETGEFLWQHSNEKLSTGRVHDWPEQGICSAPIVDGNRVWYVSSRGEVVCLDAEGFRDDENDGPYKSEAFTDKAEADIIWAFDMMGDLGVSQHNMCACSPCIAGDVLLINTSNGLDESHINLPAPNAPSFIALDKNTGKVLWTDGSPGRNILHGQWSSPTYAEIGGRGQALFAGGDGWLYSFDPNGDGEGKSKLLWKFDCNPKDSQWILGGSGTRNNLIATPVVYDGLVYVAVGQDPEHGEGKGHLWCIDPTKNGNVSPTLAVDKSGKEIPHRRIQAIDETAGEKAVLNDNSAVVWHYDAFDLDGNGKTDFEETMHRSCGTVAIKDDILYISDFSGLFHCLNARTGKPYWTYDMFAAAWGSPLIVDGKVYIGDEDGDVAIFKHGTTEGEPMEELSAGSSVYSTPVVANGRLYIANKSALFAIKKPGEE